MTPDNPDPLTPSWLTQPGCRCRLEWGRHGVRLAAARGDLIVVVDVLRFSTTAAAAAQAGVILYPCLTRAEAVEVAARVGGVAGVSSRKAPAPGQFSLSPVTYAGASPGRRVAIASPNGATCCRICRRGPGLLVGAIVNARAVAAAVREAMARTGASVTVLACGERWPASTEDGELRMAIEDGLGAGAIVAGLDCQKSPEALVWQAAFEGLRDRLPEVLLGCASGLELRELGREADVRFAAAADIIDAVPVMRGERLEPLRTGG